MKFVVIHNDYGTRSGEEVTVTILRLLGNMATLLSIRRSSAEIARRLWAGPAHSGRDYSPGARRYPGWSGGNDRTSRFVQNLYPLSHRRSCPCSQKNAPA
jgi:hypothetical protein